MQRVRMEALTAEAFAPFGEVIAPREETVRMINAGRCARHHALGRVTVGEGAAVISIFRSEGVELPYICDLVERHPLGSQAFVPLGPAPWLSVVAEDGDDAPGALRAFLVPAGTGLNLRAGVWHGVLTPLGGAADFLVVDREGPGVNLEEVRIEPVEIVA